MAEPKTALDPEVVEAVVEAGFSVLVHLAELLLESLAPDSKETLKTVDLGLEGLDLEVQETDMV